MNLSEAKAFNGFILEARNAFDRVFNREVTEEKLECRAQRWEAFNAQGVDWVL